MYLYDDTGTAAGVIWAELVGDMESDGAGTMHARTARPDRLDRFDVPLPSGQADVDSEATRLARVPRFIKLAPW